MTHKEPTRLEMLLAKIAFRLYGKSVYKKFADRLPLKGDEQVLDFGCGMGTVAYYTSGKLVNGHLTCLDISSRWLDACRKTLKKYENITYVLSDASGLGRDCFNVVYCHFVLHDIEKEELIMVIPQLVNSLKPNGVLCFREPLSEIEKIGLIKSKLKQIGMIHKGSRVINIPLMGSTLESYYINKNWEV